MPKYSNSKEGFITFDMTWYLDVLGSIDSKRSYSRKELSDILKDYQPDISVNMCNWAIDQSVKKGLLFRRGYNAYILSDGNRLKEYRPDYSQESLRLVKEIKEKYPDITFTVFETLLMNEFLNHLIGKNTVFVQAEKESSIFVFRYLQELGYSNVLYMPDKKEFRLYWEPDCVIVTNLVSESPLKNTDPYMITLEKLLVDMIADKVIASTYSLSELDEVFELSQKIYRLDQVRMLRYARRRNKEDQVRQYIGEY